MQDVVAFGDGNNDVELLAWAGLSVAMSHGRENARKAAKLISPSWIDGQRPLPVQFTLSFSAFL